MGRRHHQCARPSCQRRSSRAGTPFNAEQRAWAELALRFPRLAEDQQERARKRVEEWAALTPEQRQLARSNYRLAKALPPEARVQQYEAYRELTPEQRGVLRSAGSTSNTAAALASPTVGLAKDAAQPMPRDQTLRRLPPPAPEDSGSGDAIVAGPGGSSAPSSESGTAGASDTQVIDAAAQASGNLPGSAGTGSSGTTAAAPASGSATTPSN